MCEARQIQIFIGESVQNRSEYDCLRAVVAALKNTVSWAYVFANFNAGGRQIDLAVFTEKSTLVIEAKGYSLPIRGGLNGQWEQRGPYGVRKVGNAYVQALNAKNALRDEMQRVSEITGYPNGFVAVVPVIPDGSSLTSGDFKIGVGDINQIGQQLIRTSGALLTPDICKSLAKHLALDAATSVEAALNDEVLIAERLCEGYLKAFGDYYRPPVKDLIADKYACDADEVGPSQVQSMVASDDTAILIHGPSGCGKTLLTTSCAVSCVTAGCIPIFLSAKNFDGEFHRLLDAEIVLLDTRSAKSLITACRLLHKRIILFIDGYNECRDDLKVKLTRGLKTFAQRYGTGIVVSTQNDLTRSDLLTTKTVQVRRPSDELKYALARLDQQDDRAGNLRSLLQATSSGLEAGLVGHVGTFLPAGASRFALFDTYARKKLGNAASECIRALSALADVLIQRTCFSLSVREFDRLCDANNLSDKARQHMLGSMLLQIRSDRVSFTHELFFSAFSAEAAIRSTNGDLARIRALVGSPRYFSSRVFIIGALEDDHVVRETLKRVANPDLLAACSRGECGAIAQSLTKGRIEDALQTMVVEARDIKFVIVGEGWHSIAIDKSTLHGELGDFDAYLTAIGEGLIDGQFIERTMTACLHLDQAIATFSNAQAAEAKARKIPLRHDIFSAAYVMHAETAISKLTNFVHSGGLFLHRNEGQELKKALHDAWARAETAGQFYFLIRLTKFSSHHTWAARYVAQLLKNVRSYPYHLQLDLIDFAQYLHEAEEPYRSEIIAALEACLDKLGAMMNSIIFEALKSLGALEENTDGHALVVRNEIEDTLRTEGHESDLAAWGLFSCQFDHPYDVAYWEEIQGLDEPRKKLLLTKACRGAEAPYLSFLGILIQQLSEFNGSDVGSVIGRWAVLPDRQKSFMPQDAIEVFVSAHEALGRIGTELPQSRGEPKTPVENALLACGELFYWASRTDIEKSRMPFHTEAARSALLDHVLCVNAGVLQLTTSRMHSVDGTRISLVKHYPELCAEICREALKRRDEQASYFEYGFQNNAESIARFAIQVLGEKGKAHDLHALRSLCDDERYGITALKAIRDIEDRVSVGRV